MKTNEAYDVNDACINSLRLLDKSGVTQHSEKGTTVALNRVLTEVYHPEERHITLVGRNYDIYAMLAECFWVLSGTDLINPWLTKFLKRAPLYSDDGARWYRAYGPMLYRNAQWDGVVKYLESSSDSRQAVLSIFDPAEESYQACVNNIGTHKVKDRSCNNLLYFFREVVDTTGTERLSLHVTNRSSDNIWGAWSINMPEFTLIQEITAELLGWELGIYSFYQNNSHVYLENDVAKKQYHDLLARNGEQFPPAQTSLQTMPMDLGSMQRVSDVRQFFAELIDLMLKPNFDLRELAVYMDGWNISEMSTLYQYAAIVAAQITGSTINLRYMSTSLATAVVNSKFRKHEYSI